MQEDSVTVLSQKDAQIEALMAAGKELLGNQQKVRMEQLALDREAMANAKWAFRHRFWLITGIIVAILTIAVGLIFAKDRVDDGMKMLTHVAALVAGVLSGIGLEKIKKG